MPQFDFVIVGAGIVGAATAYRLIQDFPKKRILLLDKEAQCASHQTGRNSGVIHAGVYYQPGSLKAEYCKEGLRKTVDFCVQHNLPYAQCGKLLVATNERDILAMEALYQRAHENGLSPQRLSQKELKQKEPNVSGLGAIFIEETGIVNYKAITQTLISKFVDMGGQVAYGQKVENIEENSEKISVITQQQTFAGRFLINCAGIYADELARKQGLSFDFKLLPFRGEYFRLPAKYNTLINHLIYPIPDPSMPFLGVHLTKMIDGSVTVGPNAVLALGKEAYAKTQFNLKDLFDVACFRGTYPMLASNVMVGLSEIKNSVLKRGYLKRVQAYCPQITIQDLLPYPSGIRAQAVDRNGKLLHDFAFLQSAKSLHVGNAPSPAATSAFPIANAIVNKVLQSVD